MPGTKISATLRYMDDFRRGQPRRITFDKLCENIKAIRLELKMSQPEFAELVHVRENTVCRWETGRVTPPIQRLWALADLATRVFGERWTIDRLVGREGPVIVNYGG